ncbi:MAG: LacI family DNA-binding transcriptional regulator [Pseudomonadota bacterium]
MNLKELADALSLSPTTVSRALNGYPEVSEATRLRVQAAAAQMNYRPSARARSLALGRSMAIAHVLPIANQHEMINPVFSDFIAGAAEVYHEAGYAIMLSLADAAHETAIYRDLAAQRSVDGILVHAPTTSDPRIELLTTIGLPFVVHGRKSDSDAGYSWVDVNNRRAFQSATQHLIELGHRRIALINGQENMDFAARRRQGYERALAAHGIATDPYIMAADEMTETNGYDRARAILAQAAPPTAFVVASIISALGVRRAIEEAGLKLGRDVSLITHDDDLSYFRNDQTVPIFTAVRSSVRDAGRRAARLLTALIDGEIAGPATDLMEVDFVIGQSTGPAPGFGEQAS